MQHLYTRYSETHSSIRNVFARLRQSVLANSLRTVILLFVLALSCNVWGETIYFTNVALQDGKMVQGMSNAKTQFITQGTNGFEVINNLTISSTPGTASIYYNDADLANLSVKEKWGSSSTTNRYMRGLKWSANTEYTLSLGERVASSITFYGWCGSSSKTLTIGEISKVSSATKKTFEVYEFAGNFTNEVKIKGVDGDFYGIIAIKLNTAPSTQTIYLNTGVWNTANPVFVAHSYAGESVVDIVMEKCADDCSGNIYKAEVPASHTNVIFLRENTGTTGNWWNCNNLWNRTAELPIPENSNLFTITDWNNGGTYTCDGDNNTQHNCSNGTWSTYVQSFSVSFNMNGHGNPVSDQCVQSGTAITLPTAPTATGYTFAGWYADADCTQEWDFSTPVTAATTLYAKWTEDLTSPVSIKGAWDEWAEHPLEKKPGETGDVAYYTVYLTAGTYQFTPFRGDVYYKIHAAGAQAMTRDNANGKEWYLYKDGDGMKNCEIVADYAGNYTFRVNYTPTNQDKRYGVTVTYPTPHTITYQEGRPAEYDRLTTFGIPTSTTQVADGGALTLPDYTTIKIAAESGNITVYEFAGWSDGKTTYPANQTTIDNITFDLTLTATWQPVSFNIYYWDGQNEDNSQNKAINGLTPTTYTYASKDLLPTDAAAITNAAGKQGVVFKNWKVRDWSQTTFTLKDLDYTTPYHLYGDINLYAEWEEEVGCVTIAKGTYASSGNALMKSEIGTISIQGSASRDNNAIKLSGDKNDYFCIVPSKKFLAGDQLHVTFKNNMTSEKQMGFCIKKDDGKTITETRSKIPVKANSTAIDTYTLKEDDINKDGSIRIYRLGSEDRFYAIQVEQCPNVETVTATVLPGGGIIDEANATSLGYSKSVQSNGVIWYTITVAKGSHITLPTATFEGYKFESYQAQDASLTKYGAGATIVLNENQTFIAQWLPLSTGKVKATLNLNGGTFKNQADANLWQKEPGTTESYYILIDKGANLTLPELTPPAGKTFVCFTDQDNDTYDPSSPFPLPDNYDFVAQWCSSPVTLTWTGPNADNTFTINSTSTAPIPSLQTSGLPTDGRINYISDNEAIATISDDGRLITPYMAGTTTITAMFDGTGDYCPAEASYTLIVECSDPTPVIEANNMSLGCNTSITLCVKMKSTDGTNTDYPTTGYSFQWYKNSKPIDGATGSTYTVQTVGDYFVVVHQFCYVKSENTAHITSAEDAAVPEVVRMSPFLFYRPGHTYPAEQATRHLFAYKSASGNSKDCLLSAVHKRNDVRTEIDATNLTFLQTSDATDAQGRYTVTTSLNNIPTSLGWQAGDIIMVTLTPYDNCGKLSTAYADSIAIRIIDRPALAFIVSGADPNRPSRDKSELKLHGDFIEGINRADIYTQTGRSADATDFTKELPLYAEIKQRFETVPVNGYADFNILNYEPFDIIVLTDFVRTGIGSKGKTIVPVIDSLAKLVDYRPLLSLKAHMAKEEFPTWKDKGFTGNPAKPSSTQKDMTVLCLAHGIFEGMADYKGTAPTDDDYANKIIYDANGNIVVRITSKGGYEKSKALQGFKAVDAANFVNIAIISDGGSGSLVTC